MAYVVSEEFRNKEYSGESEFRGRLVIGNETVPNEQISKITIEDYIFDSSSQENNGVFYIGTFIAQKVTIKFKNLNGLDLHSGDNAQLYISQYVGNEWVEIPMGIYQIDDLAKNYQETCEIDLLDNSVKFKTNIDYSPCFVDDKANIDTILEYVCEQCGVELGTYPSINGDIETSQFDSEISGKRWISYIAELKGSNAKIGRDGHLYLIPLKHEHTVSINALESAFWKLGEKYEISRVRFDNGVILYEKGNETNNTLYLRQDNPFILSQEAVDNIYESLLTSGEEETEEGTSIDLDLVDDVNVGTFTLYGNTSQDTIVLPNEYQQVEYIQSSGTQYINTDVKPCMNKIRCVCDMSPLTTTDTAFFGSRGTYYLFYNVGNNYFWPVSKCETIQGTLSVGNVYHIDWNKGTFEITGTDGVYEKGVRSNNTQDIGNMYIFNFNPKDNRGASAKLYNFKIYVQDVLTRDFIPCYRISDNEVGLYDLVSNTFFTNIGTGTFDKGSNITPPSPTYPQEVKVVSGDNTIKIGNKNLINNSSLTSEPTANDNWYIGTMNEVTSSSFSQDGWTITTPANGNDNNGRVIIIKNANDLIPAGTEVTFSIDITGSATLGRIRGYYRGESAYWYSNFVPIITDTKTTSTETKRYTGTFTMPNVGTADKTFRIALSQGKQSITTRTYKNVMLEIGNQATEYVANQTQSYEINLGSIELCKIGDYKDSIFYNTNTKNLFDDSVANNKWLNGNGVLANETNANTIKIYCNENETFTLSANFGTNTSESAIVIACFDENDNMLSRNAIGSNYSPVVTKTTPANTKYIYAGHFKTKPITIQLEKSSTATSFQPYEDGWYIKKEIGKKILDGTETWYGGNAGTTSLDYTYLYTKVFDGLALSGLNTCYCDKLNTITGNMTRATSVTTDTMCIDRSATTDRTRFLILTSRLTGTTTTAFKTWLASNNLTIYYQLRTPTYTKIEGQLEEQLETAKDIVLYKGVYHINQNNNDLPFNLQLDYASQNQFEMYSLQTRNYGDISLDAWDIIDYELGDETYSTYNNRKLTFEMSIMSDTNVQISNKQQEETTNMIGGSQATQTRKLKTTVNALDNKITLEAEQINTTLDAQEGKISSLEISANGLNTTVSSLQTYTNDELNKLNVDLDNYKTITNDEFNEVNSKFGNYATKNDLITIQNSVDTITTDTYTKTEINSFLVDGSVKKIQTVSLTADENGLSFDKTNAPTTSNINEKGVTVKDRNNNPILRAVYDDTIQNSIVETYRHQVHEYFIMGEHSRFEDYEDGTGCFYID